jgi:acetyl esterase
MVDQQLLDYYARQAVDFPPQSNPDISERRQRTREIAARNAVPYPEGICSRDITLPLAGRTLRARLYRPVFQDSPPALLVYFHGGGWVVGDLDTHDNLVACLAADTGLAVCSIDYRLAPEHPYPAGCHDVRDSVIKLAQLRSELEVDTEALAVGGDSSGAHLAAAGAGLVNQAHPGMVQAQLLIYPVISPAMNSNSYACVTSPVLTPAAMQFFWQQFLGKHPADSQDPCIELLLATEQHPLLDSVILVSGEDPLHDEGCEYARRLQQRGAAVTLIDAPDMTHGIARLQAQSAAARGWMQVTAQTFKQAYAAARRRK